VNVGCEACHGPGSVHAQKSTQAVAGGPKISSREQVELCASCHSRRAQFRDNDGPGPALLDSYLPVLLVPGVFHADGQIEAEDYEYHSFTQSKMYANGVRCTDCHDPHSGKHPKQGNALCTRCHSAEKFDTAAHHHHQPAGSPGAQCVSCHMPGQNYMVVHFRRDHSLRIPRPDVSQAVGSPNACQGCHADRSADWVIEAYQSFWGKNQGPHYGPILAQGRAGVPEAVAGLAALAQSVNYPTLARATAVDLLGGYQDRAAAAALERAVSDPDPLVRHAAVTGLAPDDPVRLARLLAPLLNDPVRAVRDEAASRLAEVPSEILTDAERRAETTGLEAYIEDQRYMSDLPSGAYNLGNLYAKLGSPKEAEKQYRRSLRVDDQVYMAKVNLAMLLVRENDRAEAEKLLREVHKDQPQLADVSFDYGLLLAEMGRSAEAQRALREALAANPRLAAAAYNLAVLVGPKDPKEAADLAGRAAELRPDEPRYAWTLGFYEDKAGQPETAVATLEALRVSHPGYAPTYALLGDLYLRLGSPEDALSLYLAAQKMDDLPETTKRELALRARLLQAPGR
jgi:predicted CXXCH cytochrome family protein